VVPYKDTVLLPEEICYMLESTKLQQMLSHDDESDDDNELSA
jgi:hypothetical protein